MYCMLQTDKWLDDTILWMDFCLFADWHFIMHQKIFLKSSSIASVCFGHLLTLSYWCVLGVIFQRNLHKILRRSMWAFLCRFLLYLSPSLSFPSRLSYVCTLSHSDIISFNKFDWLDRWFQHVSYYILNMSIMIKVYIQSHGPQNTFCISSKYIEYTVCTV